MVALSGNAAVNCRHPSFDGYAHTVIEVRDVDRDDLAALGDVARRCGQEGVMSAEDDHYVHHIAGHGRFVVALQGEHITGFGGIVHRGQVAFLTDLFVDPDARSLGVGRLLLTQLWNDDAPRATCASQDPRALALYGAFGARPRWPMLYLAVTGRRAEDSAERPLIRPMAAGDAGWPLTMAAAVTMELSDHRRAVVLPTDTDVTVARMQAPTASDVIDVIDAIRGFAGAERTVHVTIPGPHPAVSHLMRDGAHLTDVDLWCASDEACDAVDPQRDLPSPQFG